MINLGQISAQTDQMAASKLGNPAEKLVKDSENNLQNEALFEKKIIEIAKSRTSALKNKAETYGIPKEMAICRIENEEVKLYFKTKEKIVIKIKELFGDICSIYLSSNVQSSSQGYDYIVPYINITWDGKDRKDTESEFGYVPTRKLSNYESDDEPTMQGLHRYWMNAKDRENRMQTK